METGRPVDFPGHDLYLAGILEMYGRVVTEGSGHIMFVVGDEGSGRTALLRGLAEQGGRMRPQPFVVAGGFEDGRYVAWHRNAALARVAAHLEQMLTAAEPGATLTAVLEPRLELLAQVVSGTRAAIQLANSLVGEGEASDLSVLMPRALRRLCEEEGPVVCVVEDAHLAPSIWSDDVLRFGPSIGRDIPVLLIMGVDGPAELGPHKDDEPDVLLAARELTGRGLASWYPIRRVTVEDLGRWTGPATPDVLRRVLDVTGGRADWTAQLWRDWQQSEAIEQTPTDVRWRFTPERQRGFDAVEDLLGERVRKLVGTSDLKALQRARWLVCCAALEGRRFTAEAVAAALGRDRDDVNDELDALEYDQDRPDGLVIEEGPISVSDESGERTLWLYRFRAQLDWLTLRHRCLTDNEKRDLSLRLAQAIRMLYGGEARMAAGTLARLYETAGRVDDARDFRRMAEIGVSRDVILWRARNVLASLDPESRAERRRASQILIAGAEEVFDTGPFTDGLRFAQEARRLAVDRRDEAMALFLSGAHRMQLGEDDETARREFTRALELQRELGNRRLELQARHALAGLHWKHREYDEAEAEDKAVLKLAGELGDRTHEAAALYQLALVDKARGNDSDAKDKVLAVLELASSWHLDYPTEIRARRLLGHIERERGESEKAEAEFRAMLELARRFSDRLHEALARHDLALISYDRGKFAKAKDEFLAVREIAHELGFHAAENAALDGLARIAKATGESDNESGGSG